MPDSLF